MPDFLTGNNTGKLGFAKQASLNKTLWDRVGFPQETL